MLSNDIIYGTAVLYNMIISTLCLCHVTILKWEQSDDSAPLPRVLKADLYGLPGFPDAIVFICVISGVRKDPLRWGNASPPFIHSAQSCIVLSLS